MILSYAKQSLLLPALVLLFINASAQRMDMLKLQSGNYPLVKNMDKIEPADFDAAKVGDAYYVYMHFSTLPSPEERAQLKGYGVTLHHYLPENTYEAEMKLGVNFNSLTLLGVDGIYLIGAEHKMSSALYSGRYPEHAYDGQNLQLNAQYFDNFSFEFVQQYLVLEGIQVVGHYDFSHLITIVLPESKLNDLAAIPFLNYIEPIDPPAEPENLVGRTNHRSAYISNTNLPQGGYNGDGVWVALGDDGLIGPHIDYQGRADQSLAGPSVGSHGDHVAGIIMGAGNLDPVARGMAWGADLKVYDVWDAVNSTPTSYFNPGVVVTSTSYGNGCNAGYTTFAQTADQQVRTMPNLMHVFSAGNSGTSDCGYGAGSGWGNVTGGIKIGKNVMAVANLLYTDNLANSSSRGPAHDGRIKPDISAVGTNVYSCSPNNNYVNNSGTSMACPGVSGTYAQLVEAYRAMNGGTTPNSALVKGTILNTADDLGNIGPDFKFGWGRINARRVVEVFQNGTYLNDSITQGNIKVHNIVVPAGLAQLNIMIYWNDYEAAPNAQKALVNNIDMQVNDPSASTHFPWILDPTPNATNLNMPATNGVDTLNNMEQVRFDNPAAGTYSILLNGTSIPQGAQSYYIIYEFVEDEITVVYPVAGESFVQGITETIRWDAPEGTQPFVLEYSTDNGNTWAVIASVASNLRYFDWSVPSVITGEALIRVTRGADSDTSDQPFSIIGVPTNIQVNFSCPDSFGLVWNAVTGATMYEVSVLGTKYMDSVTTVTTNSATLSGYSANQTYWVSVKAMTPTITGRRAYAIEKTPGTWNCIIPNDVDLHTLVSPSGNSYFNCVNYDSMKVTVEFTNSGTQPMSNFDLSYQYNNGTVVTETYSGTLAPGASDTYQFSTTFSLALGGQVPFSVWKSLPDDNPNNDTIDFPLAYFTGLSVNLPYTEDFESFANCGTSTNCEQEVCVLNNGWRNMENGVLDDIDFRTNNGGTPSNSTGPSIDHNPGTSAGKYLYIEASGTCNFTEAAMVSPCIDLTNATLPEATFWYHMLGNAMGELHVDVLSGGTWHTDVIQPVSGNQGSNWLMASINLVPYVGNIINVRIRAISGSSWQSDIAVDDFAVMESTSSPTSDFEANLTNACAGQAVLFTDLSTGIPNVWNWTIFPSTYTFINNTSATSQNPEVQFLTDGNYTVKLVSSNVNGADSLIKSNYITVQSGTLLPLMQDFNGGGFPPFGWSVDNPDNGVTWALDNVTGSDGIGTLAAFMDNFNYNAAGQEDGLTTELIAMQNVNAAMLYFDLAYRRYDPGFADGLRIEVSTDCGLTFTPTGYFKSGTDLATGPDQTTQWSPAAAGDWRRDSVDLSAYAGQAVYVRFVSITGYGNSLYIDNINIDNQSVTVAILDMESMACKDKSYTIGDISQGVNMSYIWDFGQDATPATANTPGPHQVVYSSFGVKTVTLTVTGQNGSDNTTQQVDVVGDPIPGFTWVYNQSIDAVEFTNTSQDAQSYLWDFGDGTTSTLMNPVHQFPAKGNYIVTLTADNPCRAVDTNDNVGSYPVGIIENGGSQGNLIVYPNPSKGLYNLDFSGLDGQQIDLVVYDLKGKVLKNKSLLVAGNRHKETLRLNGFAKGVYIMKVSSEKYSANIRLVIQ